MLDWRDRDMGLDLAIRYLINIAIFDSIRTSITARDWTCREIGLETWRAAIPVHPNNRHSSASKQSPS